MTVDVQVHYVDTDQIVVSRGPLLVRVIERARTEFADIDRVLGLFETLAKTYPRVGILVVVHHGAPIPAPPVLRYMAESSASIAGRGATVFVLLGLGFWAMSAHRSVAELTRFTGVDVPLEVQIETAAKRLAGLISELDADWIVRTYEAAAQLNSAQLGT